MKIWTFNWHYFWWMKIFFYGCCTPILKILNQLRLFFFGLKPHNFLPGQFITSTRKSVHHGSHKFISLPMWFLEMEENTRRHLGESFKLKTSSIWRRLHEVSSIHIPSTLQNHDSYKFIHRDFFQWNIFTFFMHFKVHNCISSVVCD